MIKIVLHSVTDLITNSSTVIFTYSDGCIEPLKNMITEIAKIFGFTKSFDEMFEAVIMAEDDYIYENYLEDLDEEDYPEGVTRDTDISKLMKDVKTGKIAKPEWFEEAENREDSYDYYRPSNVLHLIPKNEEYEALGNAILKFLYSTDHEATRDG